MVGKILLGTAETVYQVVVDGESGGVDAFSRVQDFIACRSWADYASDAIERLNRNVIHTLVLRCGRGADGEWPENLPGVAMIVGADLGDKHIAALEDSIREMLRRYAYAGIAHRRRCHIVNVGLATQPQVGSLHDSGQFVFGDARMSLAFKRLNRQITKIGSSPQELDLLLALDQPELHQLR